MSDILVRKKCMRSNTAKCHLIVAGLKCKHAWVRIGRYTIWENNNAKLSGINIENRLKYDVSVFNKSLEANLVQN